MHAMDKSDHEGEEANFVVDNAVKIIIPGHEILSFITHHLGINLQTILAHDKAGINFNGVKETITTELKKFKVNLPKENFDTLPGALRYIGFDHYDESELAEKMSKLYINKDPNEQTIEVQKKFTKKIYKEILTRICTILCNELEKFSHNTVISTYFPSIDILIQFDPDGKEITIKTIPANQAGPRRSILPILTLTAAALAAANTTTEQITPFITKCLPESVQKKPCVLALEKHSGQIVIAFTVIAVALQLTMAIISFLTPTSKPECICNWNGSY